MESERTFNASEEDRRTKWDILTNQDKSLNEEQRQRRGFLINRLFEYFQDSLKGEKVDLEQLRSDYKEYRAIERSDVYLLQACDYYYGVLQQEYPDIYPVNERLYPSKIEQMIDPEVGNYAKEIVEDPRFNGIVEKCRADGREWFENYLEYASFLAEKLYGDNRSPILIFDPNKKHGEAGHYKHKLEYDGSVFGHITLYRNSKYENFRDEPRNHDEDLEIIAHEMWHCKQAVDVRTNPDNLKAKLYDINLKFYISPDDAGLHDYLYHQQLVEREALYFGKKIGSVIKDN